MKAPIEQIKPNPKNPRVIRDEKFTKLKKSLQDFPQMLEKRPLVVFTDTDGKFVVLGGNMRLKAAKELGMAELPIIIADDWTEEQKAEFLIKDNVGFGEWDWSELQADWDVEQLENWGLDVPVFEQIDNLEEGDAIEIPQSVQLEPPKEYILIMANPNSIEWEDLKETLKLKMVRRGGYKEGSAFDAVALERVIEWTDLKNRLNVNSGTK
jgi:ParB-like chromosome segregation protein Spo0J